MSTFGRIRKSLKHQVRRVENFAHRLSGKPNIGTQQPDPNANKGPQFTDAARSQAAGAGTVNFTQRTQNY
jgi:hypothetical protein